MALSIRFATESDIPALVKLRLAVDADQARRFGKKDPLCQQSGIGRHLIDHAIAVAREWPVGAIRLDAYDRVARG
jgi:hypothetical protein